MLTLGQLIGKLKPCVTDDFYNKLNELNRMRIEIVHRSNYVEGVLRGVGLPTMVGDDISRFHEIKNYAEKVYADLYRVSL
jgi:hypothetical protein